LPKIKLRAKFPMSFLSRSNVCPRRYGDRMPATIEELKSDVDTLKSRMDVADSDRMETNQLLKDLKKDIGSLSANVASLYHPLMSTATDDIARILGGIGDLKTDVTLLKTDVTDLKGNVSRLTTDVAILKTDVAGLKADMGEVKQTVTALTLDVG